MLTKYRVGFTTAACLLVLAGIAVTIVAWPAAADEPLRVRRNFMGMHNLKDGGVEFREGMDWTKNLTGDTGFVFDWVSDYSPTSYPHWIEEACKRNLVPCVRVQNCNGGCTPSAGYAGEVAAQICNWKLAHPEYADRLVYMQLWNEPGDPRDYVPMDVYADYLVAAHAAVHNAENNAAAQNPNIAGTLKTMTPGQNNPDSWQIGFNHNPQAVYAFDVWGTHPYPESYPPSYNMHEGHGFVTKHKMIDSYLRDLDKCAEYGRRGVKVMITETAYGDHLGISYEGYPKTTRQMAADYNVEAFGTWWYRWPEIIAVHPFILHNFSWEAFAWVATCTDSPAVCGPNSVDVDPPDGVREPTRPYPQYTAVRNWRIATAAQGLLAPARLTPYRGAVGRIRGNITRADTGEPVKHANVFTDGYEFGGPSLFDGRYDILDVPVGTYTLSVDKRGYVSASQQITVYQNQETVANFSLVYTGKVPKGIYFVDCGAPGLECQGNCSGCSLYATVHGQTFKTPSDVGFIKFCAVKPNVGDVRFRFTIIQGSNPNGTVVGSFEGYYLEPTLGGEMIGGEAPGDGIPVQPNTTYFLKIERTDGQGVYLYTSNSNPYPDGNRWVGGTSQPNWDIYGTIRGNTVEVVTARGTIAGNVKDTNNNPIYNAVVSTSPGNFQAATNASGNYTITNVPVGTYSVTATQTGYSSETITGRTVYQNQTTTVNFVLQPGPTTGTITGWVKTQGGSPIVGATVQTTLGGYSTTTNGSGVYTLSNVAPGGYTVQASKTGYLTEQVPGVLVIAGQTTTTNITLPAQVPFSGLTNGNMEGGSFNDPNADHKTANGWHQFTLSGFSKSNVTWLGSGAHSANYVQDFWESGYVSGIYQQASGATAGNRYQASTWVKASDANVTFRIGIDPLGRTDPQKDDIVWSGPANPGATWTQISVQATANSSTVTVFIKAENPTGNRNSYIDDATLTDQGPTQTGTIAGWVKDDANNPIEGAIVATSAGGYSGTTNASGNYTISNVVVGTYSVSASKAGYDTETASGVSVTNGQTATVNFNLSESAAPAAGEVAGVVKNAAGAAIQGATVRISQIDGDYSASTTTNAYGQFTLTAVPTGTYTADADAPSYLRSVKVTIRVASNESTEVNFTLQAATPFNGLSNGNMEGGFYNNPDVDHKSPNSWARFIVSGAPKHGGYWSTSNHSPNWSQVFYEANWTAGIYQQVSGTEMGTTYTASVWVKGHDQVKFWIGVDPAGGTNPNNADWTINPVVPGGTWTKISKQVQAGGSTITVFLKAQNPTGNNLSGWFDDASITTP